MCAPARRRSVSQIFLCLFAVPVFALQVLLQDFLVWLELNRPLKYLNCFFSVWHAQQSLLVSFHEVIFLAFCPSLRAPFSRRVYLDGHVSWVTWYHVITSRSHALPSSPDRRNSVPASAPAHGVPFFSSTFAPFVLTGRLVCLIPDVTFWL